jgi:ornithine carbamoyltransferase
MRHLTSLFDLTAAEIERIFAITEDLKTKYNQGLREALLPGRVVALIFEKPSLRTRVSFEAGVSHLGGNCLFLGDDSGFGSREAMPDFARVLSQYVDAVVIRAKKHETVTEFARYSGCPVINGLTDYTHPCQGLADLYTLRERWGQLAGQTLTYVGDCNNVARSLAIACGKLGVRLAVATPVDYSFDAEFLARLQREVPDSDLVITPDAAVAVSGASAVYTDVWASMGQEAEAAARRRAFAPYQVNAQLMQKASPDAVFLHCLPAHRGEEVTDEVIDGPNSAVVDQAANRMHVQKGILLWLLGLLNRG